MSANIPAYSKIGASAKEVLLGGKEGVFQFAQKATVSGKTVDGVDYAATYVKQDKDSVSLSLRTTYTADKLKFTSTFAQNGKVVASLAATELAPGLSATLTGTIPDVSSGKLGVDYVAPHLTLNSTISLASSPLVDIALTTGRSDAFFGGQAAFNTSTNSLTAWTLGAGLTRPDFQVGVSLLDKGQLVKGVYAHAISKYSLAAAEVTRRLDKGSDTAIAVGFQQRLDNGALAKGRLESTGLATLHYEAYLKPKTKAGVSAQLDAKDLNKPPRVGGFLDIIN